MLGLLKNVLLTALIVVVATIASTMIAALASVLLSPSFTGSTPPDMVALTFGLIILVGLAMLVGMLFCVLTLFVAALTMPPVIWLARLLNLPRPLVDVVGGALAAWLCAAAGLSEADSLRQYNLTFPEPLCVGVAVVFGALLGYVRYRVLARAAPASASTASALQAL